jgi:isopentenyldiphosphate isomerase
MLNSNELLFTVDENNSPIEPLPRSTVHATGVWHRTTDIWVYNSKGQILCNKRSTLKDSSPGLWDLSFGGHVLAGTESVQSAIDELREESGIAAFEKDLELIFILRDDALNKLNRQFRYVYAYRWNGDLEQLCLEADEVDEVAWFDIESLRDELIHDEVRKWAKPPQVYEIIDLIKLKL